MPRRAWTSTSDQSKRIDGGRKWEKVEGNKGSAVPVRIDEVSESGKSRKR